jgi:heat shock protein HslJ
MKHLYRICLIVLVGLTGCSVIKPSQVKPQPVHTLYIGPERVECVNPYRNNQCFQVKEKLEDQWSLYKGEIMGLQYEPGFYYHTEVQADVIGKPDKDAPAIQWILFRLISKTVEPETTALPITVQGKTWILEQYGDLQTPTTASGDTPPTLFFQSDGHVSGSSGCNRFNATFVIAKDRIQFGELAATKKMCPTPTAELEQEQMVFSILQQADHFELNDTQLKIISSGNHRVLIYKK